MTPNAIIRKAVSAYRGQAATCSAPANLRRCIVTSCSSGGSGFSLDTRSTRPNTTRSYHSFTLSSGNSRIQPPQRLQQLQVKRCFASKNKRDFYELLGVPKSADKATIKKAYFKLAKKYHPDTNQVRMCMHDIKLVATRRRRFDWNKYLNSTVFF